MNSECFKKRVGNAVDLRQIAGAERTGNGCHSKNAPHDDAGFDRFLIFPPDVEPVFHVIHRATGNGAVCRFFAVFMGECNFHKFCGHSDGGSNQHPEKCSRAAKVDGERHTGNVPRTYSSRQGCCQRLKMGGVAFIAFAVKFAAHNADGMSQVAKLRKFQINRKKDAGAEKEENKPL